MKNLVLAVIIIVGSISVVSAQETLTLTVKVEGVISSKGILKLEVFNKEDGFLTNPLIAENIDLVKEDVHLFLIEGLVPGEYAISVLHDNNGNGELDMGMMGPTEAYGFSNDARGMYGPPKFKEAVMKIDSDITTTISIR